MSIVENRRCVVTGKVPDLTRPGAEAKLREAGAIVQSAVGKDTDLLIIGAAVGAKKMNAAREQGITIVPWEQAFLDEPGNYAPPPPRAPMPKVRQWAPMLCSPATEIPTGDGWLFEIKWDGLRGVSTVENGTVAIQSRTGKTDLAERYPFVTNDLEKLVDCVLDGELVDIDGNGTKYIIFDVLSHLGEECTQLPLTERRKIADKIVAGTTANSLGVSPVFDDGEALLDWLGEEGHEGLVAKRPESRYVEGGRGPEWRKVKIRLEQEFVIAGYTPGEGSRASTFGALILAYYQDGVLTHAGKVGTGFDGKKLRELTELMNGGLMRQFHVTSLPGFPSEKGAVYIKNSPLVAQIAFQKWTEDGVLWHPSFQRVRDDKLAEDVIRET